MFLYLQQEAYISENSLRYLVVRSLRSFPSILIATILALCCRPLAAQNSDKCAVLEPTKMLKVQMDEIQEHGWIALAYQNGRWVLEPTRIRAILNAEYEKKYGKDKKAGGDDDNSYDVYDITSSQPGTKVMFHSCNLKAGPVDTAKNALGKTTLSKRHKSAFLNFHGHRYSLFIENNEFVIRSSGKQSTLEPLLADDATFSVLWAGDIDHDGKLDLLLEFSDTDAGGVILFTSDGVHGTELVKEVARWSVDG